MFSLALKTIILYCTLNKYEYVAGFDIHRHNARIIHGTDVDIKDFPHFAGLSNCGAAILSESWVVTAAHCVYDPYGFLRFVWVGGESFATSQRVSIDRVVAYDHYDNRAVENDIALLHLSEPLNFTDKIRPVDLPSFKDLTRSNAGSNFELIGRGIDESGRLSRNVQKMDIRRLSTEECLSHIPRPIREQLKPIVSSLEKAIICAKRVDGGPGLCAGDSGSPLTQEKTLFGVASFIGDLPCEFATLGFYVNVANYVPWIKSVTGLK